MSSDVAYHSLITPKLNQRGWRVRREGSFAGRVRAALRASSDTLRDRRALLTGVLCTISLLLLGCWGASSSAALRAKLGLTPHAAARLDAGLEYRALFHGLPEYTRTLSDVFVQEATEGHSVTILELHGLGGRWYENPFRGALAELCPWIKWVAPQARVSNITVRGGEPTTAWFDIATFADLYEHEDEQGMIESQREIHALIEQERQVLRDLGREERIVLAGFSQGAVMSLLAAITAEKPIEAALLLSGYLPLVSKKALLGPVAPHSTKIWWGHGKDDIYLTPELAAQSVDTLRQPPYSLEQVEYTDYAGLGHYWSFDEMSDLQRWVRQNIPQDADAMKETQAERRRGRGQKTTWTL